MALETFFFSPQVVLSLTSSHNAVYRMLNRFRPLFEEFQVKMVEIRIHSSTEVCLASYFLLARVLYTIKQEKGVVAYETLCSSIIVLGWSARFHNVRSSSEPTAAGNTQLPFLSHPRNLGGIHLKSYGPKAISATARPLKHARLKTR